MIKLPSADEVIDQICALPDDYVVISGDHRMTVAEFREWYPKQDRIKGVAVYEPERAPDCDILEAEEIA